MVYFKMGNNSNLSKYLLPVIILWTVIGCLIPNICLSVTEGMSVIQRITNIVLSAGIYWLLMSLTRNTGKAGLWMVILDFFRSVPGRSHLYIRPFCAGRGYAAECCDH